MKIKKADNLEIRILADLEELSRHACQLFISASKNPDIFTVAISGGSTPKRMFELLATDYKESIFWPKVHVFWGDEGKASHHPESNFQRAFQPWLSHIPANLHPIKIELGLVEGAQEYTRQIDSLAPDGFDLTFNGAGADGHRNGVMIENPRIGWKNDIWDLSASTKVWGYAGRITLTPWFLNKSKTNVLMLAGKDKADLLRKLILDKEKYNKRELPALTFNDVPTIVLADEAAASNI
ncbi:MAG: hypothetical protein A2896_01425 [Candidatus Nealsonbacteria bacterium RIFCSPLOWO2_01_FULL_43_32]|uniref:Glucosamine/galactosamine-6-phosphate isomerase domain-containing protein n=1 Tax=Candidatus Nealsonbacteria bacterium RIFCSPLOWO2_01_FULL_43_32 TaxID=1801672 RepID=A0A1G2EDS8_9BACT|nr:MAG: hypothetical protein A2896_01425 [Candidatus Nealsonbacteria bacterium RIFCSPLOWO2_01_FULL_43_32]